MVFRNVSPVGVPKNVAISTPKMSVALRSVLFLAGLGISFRRVFLVYFWSQILAKIFRPKVAGGVSARFSN